LACSHPWIAVAGREVISVAAKNALDISALGAGDTFGDPDEGLDRHGQIGGNPGVRTLRATDQNSLLPGAGFRLVIDRPAVSVFVPADRRPRRLDPFATFHKTSISR